MEPLHRIYDLDQLLRGARQPVALRRIIERLECSPATAKRIIRDLRDSFRAPLVYDRRANGYRYETGDTFELPGLWFTASELHALLAARQLLADAEPGVLANQIAPLAERIEKLLAMHGLEADGVADRVRLLAMQRRQLDPAHFATVAGAVLQGRQLAIVHRGRQHEEAVARTVSPQRLVRYRDNWYLDAWCHLRDGLRTFSLDRIEAASRGPLPALVVAAAELDAHFAAAYGIFAGPVTATAVLRFDARVTRWVAEEGWHPEQRGCRLADGRYELHIPYGEPVELVRDILRYAGDVEVVAPEALRAEVLRRGEALVRAHGRGEEGGGELD